MLLGASPPLKVPQWGNMVAGVSLLDNGTSRHAASSSGTPLQREATD